MPLFISKFSSEIVSLPAPPLTLKELPPPLCVTLVTEIESSPASPPILNSLSSVTSAVSTEIVSSPSPAERLNAPSVFVKSVIEISSLPSSVVKFKFAACETFSTEILSSPAPAAISTSFLISVSLKEISSLPSSAEIFKLFASSKVIDATEIVSSPSPLVISIFELSWSVTSLTEIKSLPAAPFIEIVPYAV